MNNNYVQKSPSEAVIEIDANEIPGDLIDSSKVTVVDDNDSIVSGDVPGRKSEQISLGDGKRSDSLHSRTKNASFEGDDIESNIPKSVVEIDNIHKTYLLGVEGVAALRGVSLSIQKGEWVSIFGPSGSGKTSLLNIIGTIDKPTKGTVTIDNNRITHLTTDETLAKIRRESIGFVFQTFNLLSSMNSVENVEMPMVLSGKISQENRNSRAMELLKRVRMDQRKGHKPSMMSGGEQQRVTIARAVSNQPEILLLDEPTGDLDSGNTNMVMELLHELNTNENITLIMVTHDVSLKNFANRVVWMRDGKIQRIEIVSEKKRRARIAKLRKTLAEAGLETNFYNGENENKTISGDISHTNLRTPMAYKSYRHIVDETEGKYADRLEERLRRTAGGMVSDISEAPIFQRRHSKHKVTGERTQRLKRLGSLGVLVGPSGHGLDAASAEGLGLGGKGDPDSVKANPSRPEENDMMQSFDGGKRRISFKRTDSDVSVL